MKFTLPRNRTIIGTCGRAIEFKKGEPTYVPPSLYAAVIAAGGVSDEELKDDEPTSKTQEPDDPVKRKEAIFKAFEDMVLADEREEFTGTGAPHAKSLIKYLGFAIDSKERDLLWVEFQQGKDEKGE